MFLKTVAVGQLVPSLPCLFSFLTPGVCYAASGTILKDTTRSYCADLIKNSTFCLFQSFSKNENIHRKGHHSSNYANSWVILDEFVCGSS